LALAALALVVFGAYDSYPTFEGLTLILSAFQPGSISYFIVSGLTKYDYMAQVNQG